MYHWVIEEILISNSLLTDTSIRRTPGVGPYRFSVIVLYKIAKIVRAFWLVKNLWFIVPETHRKLKHALKLFYKSNRPHFLLAYRSDNPLRMLGEHEKSL